MPDCPLLTSVARMKVNGPAIRAIREDSGLTVATLAAAAGISTGYLSRIERGERGTKGVNPDTAAAIAAALRKPLAAIESANVGNGEAA